MISSYFGHYIFNKDSIQLNASTGIGIYYCGWVNPLTRILETYYVGRALGAGVSIKNRLLDHLNDGWSDVTNFGYKLCTSEKEVEDLEAAEIKRLQPKYNTQGKAITLEDILGLKS